MIGFLGEYEATLDSKSRFLLPVGFKKQLPEDSPTQFVINRGFEKWPEPLPDEKLGTDFRQNQPIK